MGGAFLVRRTPALAGDLSLLFGRHRREASTFLAFSCSHRLTSVDDLPRASRMRARVRHPSDIKVRATARLGIAA
jgi:hypothetical protein